MPPIQSGEWWISRYRSPLEYSWERERHLLLIPYTDKSCVMCVTFRYTEQVRKRGSLICWCFPFAVILMTHWTKLLLVLRNYLLRWLGDFVLINATFHNSWSLGTLYSQLPIFPTNYNMYCFVPLSTDSISLRILSGFTVAIWPQIRNNDLAWLVHIQRDQSEQQFDQKNIFHSICPSIMQGSWHNTRKHRQ